MTTPPIPRSETTYDVRQPTTSIGLLSVLAELIRLAAIFDLLAIQFTIVSGPNSRHHCHFHVGQWTLQRSLLGIDREKSCWVAVKCSAAHTSLYAVKLKGRKQMVVKLGTIGACLPHPTSYNPKWIVTQLFGAIDSANLTTKFGAIDRSHQIGSHAPANDLYSISYNTPPS